MAQDGNSNPEDRSLTLLLRPYLGVDAEWRRHDRTIRTPMNFLLDRAVSHLKSPLTVIWVEGGMPKMFTLERGASSVIVFSTRAVELYSFFRSVVIEASVSTLRRDLAMRGALKVVAQFLLRTGDGDLAAKAFAQSVTAKGIHLPDSGILLDLEASPISESYMATWFFGLSHELGHAKGVSEYQGFTPLSEDALYRELAHSLQKLAGVLPKGFEVVHQVSQIRSNVEHPLNADTLRGEIVADMFGVQVLLDSTVAILHEVGSTFDPAIFISEMFLAANIVVALERCASWAEFLGNRDGDVLPTSERERAMQLLVQPAGQDVRVRYVAWYLASALAQYYGEGGETGVVNSRDWTRVVTSIGGSYSSELAAVEKGLADALRFLLNPEPLENLLHTLHAEQSWLIKSEVREFCAIAESLGVTGSMLASLGKLA